MPHLAKVTYEVTRPARLSRDQLADIDQLTRESAEATFAGRSAQELDAFADTAAKHRRHLNRAVGSGALRAGQRYARHRSVVAYNESGELLAHLPLADNASSKHFAKARHSATMPLQNKVKGMAEIGAKLYMPAAFDPEDRFVTHRYLWIGYAAMHTRVAQMVAEEDPRTANVLDGMLEAGTRHRRPDQPVASCPWVGEDAWIQQLTGLGGTAKDRQGEDVMGFGRDAAGGPITQTRFDIPSIAALREAIYNKPDPYGFVEQAH